MPRRKGKIIVRAEAGTPIDVPISLAKEQPAIPNLRAHDYDHRIVHEPPMMPLGPTFRSQHHDAGARLHRFTVRPFAHQLFPLRKNPIFQNRRP